MIKKSFFELLTLFAAIVIIAVFLVTIYSINHIGSIGYGYYKNDKDIFYGAYKEKVDFGDQKIDIKSFKMLSEKYAQDKNHLYLIYFQGDDCCWAKILPEGTEI